MATNQAATDYDPVMARMKMFLLVQFFFLFVSGFTGGFQFSVWSMLDSALLLQSIGITALIPILDATPRLQQLAFNLAVLLYLAAIADMGLNVLISGVVGIRGITS